jgi:hypothetical protein
MQAHGVELSVLGQMDRCPGCGVEQFLGPGAATSELADISLESLPPARLG